MMRTLYQWIGLVAVGCTLCGCVAETHVLTSTEEMSGSGNVPLEAPDEARKWNVMTGRWYGAQLRTDGGKNEAIVQRYIDGTYEIHFRQTEPDGEVIHSMEVGYWGVSGDIYFTIFLGHVKDGVFKAYFPTNHYTRDAYRILELSENKMIYETLEAETVKFTIIRVADGFEFEDAPAALR